jgi:hypothetical protein
MRRYGSAVDAFGELNAVSGELVSALRGFDLAALPGLVERARAARGDGTAAMDERLELLQSVAADAAAHRWSGAHIRLLEHLNSSLQ